MNKEQLRKEVIQTGSVEAQKEVMEWLESIGEEIFSFSREHIINAKSAKPSIRFQEGSWCRSLKPATIT